jgi:hypothetical protein
MGAPDHIKVRPDETRDERPRLPDCTRSFYGPFKRSHGRHPKYLLFRENSERTLRHEEPVLDGTDACLRSSKNGRFSVRVGHDAEPLRPCFPDNERKVVGREPACCDFARLGETHDARSHDLNYTSFGPAEPYDFGPDIVPRLHRNAEERAVSSPAKDRPSGGQDERRAVLHSGFEAFSVLRTGVPHRRYARCSDGIEIACVSDMDVGIDITCLGRGFHEGNHLELKKSTSSQNGKKI